MKRYLLTLLGVVVFGFVACEKENEDEDLILHDVTSVSGPNLGSINTAVVLSVRYPYVNGCDVIGSFKEEKNGNIVTIKSYAAPVAKDAVCTMDAGFKTKDYSFTSSSAGSFQLQFLKPDGTAVNHTITIQ